MDTHLSERQRTERDYHDRINRDSSSPRRETGGNSLAYEVYWNLIGAVEGLSVLDFGCGNGWLSIWLAKNGARVCGMDISRELVKKAVKAAEKAGVNGAAAFKVMAAENLSFPDNSFDLIIGSAILHHTDIVPTLKHIHRTLRPGGRAIFIEPMNQNIVLRFWRRLTPWRRSPTERALKTEDLDCVRSVFNDADFHFFGLTSIFTKGLLIAFPKNRPLASANRLLERLDVALLRPLPFLGKFSAVTVLVLHKKQS